MSQGFWEGKKVLVTGHTGFKGSWLSLWLQLRGAKVSGFALQPPTTPSLFEVGRVGEGMHSHAGDIRDFEHLRRILGEEKPDVVFHLAAQSLVRYSYTHPVETYAANVMGTVHLLEAVRHAGGVRVVVNITSDKCYENREWVWPYRENEALGGYDAYSSSKACSELVTAAYRNSFLKPAGIALASARAGNVIGGGDWAADRLVPDFLRALNAGQTLTIRSPLATRPWQHVLEPLSGYLMLAERLFTEGQEFAEAWNFGPEDADARPVRWIVEYLCGQVPDAAWQRDASPQPQPHEANTLKLDSSKAKAQLGWRPRWNLQTALGMTLGWHQTWKQGSDMAAIGVQQIQEYESAAAGQA